MHASLIENLCRCYNYYVKGPFLDGRDRVDVLNTGGADVDGSCGRIFADPKIRFLAADLVLDDPYQIPFADRTFDVVISGQAFERCEFFWLAFREMVRVLKDDGLIVLIAPSAGPIHRDPVDCYRFYPDSYAALARYAGCHLLDCWIDERGPWNDLVGVFGKHGPAAGRGEAGRPARLGRMDGAALAVAAPADPGDGRTPPGADEEEVTRGAGPYLETLARVHDRLRPDLYLEIGVRAGGSLRLARRAAIGVDPGVRLDAPVPGSATLFHETSDEFFLHDAAGALGGRRVDLAFIDGLHLFEYALRDFMNLERVASRFGLIAIDDIFPNHPAQASRHRRTRAWTGDVWRLMACLRAERPDLVLLPVDCEPTGLLLIAGLDPNSRSLWQGYNPIVRRYLGDGTGEPPPEQLRRAGAVRPDDPILDDLLDGLRRLGEAGEGPASLRAFLDGIAGRLRPSPIA